MANSDVRESERIVTPQETHQETRAPRQRPRRGTKLFAGLSATEAVIGAGAAVLAILGLIGILPVFMAAIAGIAIGAAFIIEGVGMTASYSRAEAAMRGGASGAIAGGMSAETMGGIAGVALSILALLGVATVPLLAITALIYGGTLFVSAGTARKLEEAVAPADAASTSHEMLVTAEGGRVLVGLGAAVLGILALAGIATPTVLVLVAMLTVGAGLLLSGSLMGGRLATTGSR